MKADIKSSKERVLHILKAIDNIQSFLLNHTLESFLEDEKTISACLYQYTIIAEAAKNISPAILQKYEYPWYKVKSFRNFILHEYHSITMKVIWDTSEILPELKSMMKNILAEELN